MIEVDKSALFVNAFQEVDDLLEGLIKSNKPIQMSLKQLSKLHHLQRQLEKFAFLNIIYSDQSRIRKVFTQQANQHLNMQKKLCDSIDTLLPNLITHFDTFERVILHIINIKIDQTNFNDLLKLIFQTCFCCSDFTVVYDVRDVVDIYSSRSQADGRAESETANSVFKNLSDLFMKSKKSLIKNNADTIIQIKNAYLVLHDNKEPFSSEYREGFTQEQFQSIIDELLILISDHKREIYQKELLIKTIRGAKSMFIKNTQTICQLIIQRQIEEILQTKCEIHDSRSTTYKQFQQNNVKEISFQNSGKLILPISIRSDVIFYLEVENMAIDIITFSDYLHLLWQDLSFKLRELQQQDFLNQLIETYTPNKLFICVDSQYDIIYQSGPIPSSWSFVEMPQSNFDKRPNLQYIKMDQIYQKMIIEKIKELRVSDQRSIECGSIQFADKSVNIQIFIRREQTAKAQVFYLAFDPPKKKFEDVLIQIPSQTNIGSGLAIEVRSQLKTEKLEKACNIIKEQLNLSMSTLEIVGFIKDKVLENEVKKQQQITEEIKQSYIIEYYQPYQRGLSFQNILDHYDDEDDLSPYRKSHRELKKQDLLQKDIQDYTKFAEWDYTTIFLPKDQDYERIRIAWSFFSLCNYTETYQINKDSFYQFLILIQEKYNSRGNPFHNFDHAVQVAHACYYMIKNKLLNPYLDSQEQFACLISALCHDVDHTGRTNAFEMASRSKLALRYNDDSILENHHVSCTFKILAKEKYNIFANIHQDQIKALRKSVISNILHTDMKRHFEIIKQVEIKYAKSIENNEPLVQKEEDKRMVSGLVIHTCDLTGPTKHFVLSQEWSMRICQEFTSQVEEEKRLEIPLTSYLQNLTNIQSIAKQEISFIKVIIKPLYELSLLIFGSKLENTVENLSNNQKEWEKILAQQNL